MPFAPSASFSAYKPPPALRHTNPSVAPAADLSPPPVSKDGLQAETGHGAGPLTPVPRPHHDAAGTPGQTTAGPNVGPPGDGPAAYAARALASMIDPLTHSVLDEATSVIMRENHCSAREARHALRAAAVRHHLEVSDVAAAVLALAAGDLVVDRGD